MNVFNFTGNLGKDAATRHTPAGKSVTGFSVAVKSGFGDNAKTTWANCELWGDRGEKISSMLTKGQLVAVSGELTLDSYSKDGVEKQSLKVNVKDVTLLGGKQAAAKESALDTDEVPF